MSDTVYYLEDGREFTIVTDLPPDFDWRSARTYCRDLTTGESIGELEPGYGKPGPTWITNVDKAVDGRVIASRKARDHRFSDGLRWVRRDDQLIGEKHL